MSRKYTSNWNRTNLHYLEGSHTNRCTILVVVIDDQALHWNRTNMAISEV